MAAFHPSGAPEFAPVVAGHWMLVMGMDAVDADSIAAMVLTGTVPIPPRALVDRYMGAASWRTKEDQVSGL